MDYITVPGYIRVVPNLDMDYITVLGYIGVVPNLDMDYITVLGYIGAVPNLVWITSLYRDILGLSLILICGRTLGYSLEQITFMEATVLRAFR